MPPRKLQRIGVFAYGSNIYAGQMKRRCPSAVKGPAVQLRGWRLTFSGWSESWGGSVATIEPHPKSEVLGLIWWISEEDLHVLDRYEGHPVVYARQLVQVLNAKGGKLDVQVYVKPEDFYGPPSLDYLLTIWRGYNENGLPTRSLRQAAERVSLEAGGSRVRRPPLRGRPAHPHRRRPVR